jgi:hypothetical protein
MTSEPTSTNQTPPPAPDPNAPAAAPAHVGPSPQPPPPAAVAPALPAWFRIPTAFFQSGLFFMLFGTAFLYFAFANGQRAHSAMTFILVVIGSAMVLFGTGTQASGDVDGTEEGRAYKVKIAGGAGVMSLIIGFGLVLKGNDLKGVFRPERTIIVATLVAERSDAPAALSDYYVEAYLDNLPVPVVRRDRVIELYIPVTSADIIRKISPTVNIQLTHRSETKVADLVEPRPKVDAKLRLDDLSDQSGGYEFQRYASPIRVVLQRPQAALAATGDVKVQDTEIPAIKFEGF